MRPPQRMATANEWPLHDSLKLGALPSAVPCARLHARHLLREWALGDLADSVELIVSELITNALQASHAEMWADPIQLWLLSDAAQVLILVWDASPQPPIRMNTTEDAEKGRGLLLVEAVSTRWGWYFPPDADGKVVWAQARLD